jgi:DNA replication and repair protein RecF
MVLALHPGHGGHAARYERALAGRARLLAGEMPADPAWLDMLEAELAREGEALAAARRETVAALAVALAEAPVPGFPRAGLALAGDRPGADWPALLKAARGVDAASGRVAHAPHRVDLDVRLADAELPAAQASSGEQKALLLSLLLAHAGLVAARNRRVPLLLLDEVVAHLDSGRREALFAALQRLGGQAWLTGTDGALFSGLRGAFRLELARD